MKKSNDKQIRILMAIAIYLVTFLTAYIYFRYLYVNGKLLSVSGASQYLLDIIMQSFVVNAPIFIMLILTFVMLKKKAAGYLALKIENSKAKMVIIILVVIYVLSLVRQLVVYDDSITILFKWIYYLVFVAFAEELEYRALIPAILKGHFNKYVEWLLPNILFACAHLLLPMVQGNGIIELMTILISSLAGYVLGGMFFEWCKRISGSLWVGVLIHAIMDFGR